MTKDINMKVCGNGTEKSQRLAKIINEICFYISWTLVEEHDFLEGKIRDLAKKKKSRSSNMTQK